MNEKKDAYPLSWPSDWPRTSIKDQKPNQQWKKSLEYYRRQVVDELKRMKAPQSVISTHVQPDFSGKLADAMARAVRDAGVAVYFDRPHVEDFKWMNTLMLTGVPTEDEIEAQWRKLALPHHPDRGGDLSVFQAFTEARDAGRKWARRLQQPPSLVIACDTFNDVRLNLAAIALSLKAIRQLERCGTSQLLERTFKGLEMLAATAGPSAVAK
jgi:hypothetical protein